SRKFLTMGSGISAAALLAASTPQHNANTGAGHAGFQPSIEPTEDLELRGVTVRVVPNTCAAPTVNARAMNRLQTYRLSVSLRRYTGWAELWTAFVAGELDASLFLSPMPMAIHHGFASGQRDIRQPYVTNTNGNGITVSKRLAGQVNGPEDFAGLRL